MFVYQLFEEAALKYKEKVALVYENLSLSYQQTLEKINNLSNAILHFCPNEEFIGLSTTKSLETIIGMLAILKAGKAYLPIDPKYPELRIQQMIGDAQLKFVVGLNYEEQYFKNINLTIIASNIIYNLPILSVKFYCPIVCVLHTSGSTGKPKGVCLGHKGLINQINWQKGNGMATPEAKTLQYSHLSFDGGFLEIFVPLATGGTLYLINDNYRFNTTHLLNFILEHQINRLFLSFTVVQFLAETSTQFAQYPFSVKEIITGGELLRITPQIASFFNVLEDCVFMNVYGPTETSVWVTEHKMKGDALNWPPIPPIGKLVAGAQIFLVDENLQIVPNGATGEVLIYGECVALYYLNNPEQTAERFIFWEHPELGNLRVYRTGDLASLNEDDTYQFQGRADDQVKIRGGYRVELSEIESVIGKIAGISQVKVIVREDVPGQKRIVGYVTLTDKNITEKAIKHEISLRLPAYMVPDAVMEIDKFQFTVSGKIDKFSLPQPQWANAENIKQYKAPTNNLEHYLVNLWEEILQLKNVSITSDFFDLGGTSLIAILMMSRIEKEKGKQLPLVSVFESRTIEKLANLLIQNQVDQEFSPLVAIKPTGSRPPIYLIHGDNLNVLNFNGIAQHIHADQPVFGIQPKGIDGKQEPLNSLPAIAAYYNNAIIKHNPIGPYAIIGYSFGGYVAFEMAKQLKQQNKQVLLLGVLDTDAFKAENNKRWHVILQNKITRQIPKFSWIIQTYLENPKQTMSFQKQALKRRINALFNIHEKQKKEMEGFYALMTKINEVHHKALENYNLEKLDIKIVLFKAKIRPYFLDDFEYFGWKKYALQGVSVHIVPGDHVTMLLEPNCEVLASEIEKALEHV